MKSEKGVTLLTLAIYILIIVSVITILATISNDFYRNISYVSESGKYMAEVNKFNMYFVEDVKNNSEIYSVADKEIVFGDGNMYTFVNNRIYRNKVKICDNIYDVTFAEEKQTDANGLTKTIAVVEILMGGTDVFHTVNEYVLKYW